MHVTNEAQLVSLALQDPMPEIHVDPAGKLILIRLVEPLSIPAVCRASFLSGGKRAGPLLKKMAEAQRIKMRLWGLLPSG